MLNISGLGGHVGQQALQLLLEAAAVLHNLLDALQLSRSDHLHRPRNLADVLNSLDFSAQLAQVGTHRLALPRQPAV